MALSSSSSPRSVDASVQGTVVMCFPPAAELPLLLLLVVLVVSGSICKKGRAKEWWWWGLCWPWWWWWCLNHKVDFSSPYTLSQTPEGQGMISTKKVTKTRPNIRNTKTLEKWPFSLAVLCKISKRKKKKLQILIPLLLKTFQMSNEWQNSRSFSLELWGRRHSENCLPLMTILVMITNEVKKNGLFTVRLEGEGGKGGRGSTNQPWK